MKKLVRTVMAVCLVLGLAIPSAPGQDYMGKVMKKEFKLRTVACTACHLKEEKDKHKDKLTPFGVDMAKLVAGEKITERLAEAKAKSEEEEDKVEAECEKAFLETVKKMREAKGADGKTLAEAILAGEVEGIKTRD